MVKDKGDTPLTALEQQLLPELEEALAKIKPPTKPKGHLLIAEDSTIKAKQLEAFFLKAGYLVTMVDDGVGAVQKVEEGPKTYDAILMNLVMPRLHGFKATKYIRQKLHYKRPIIGFSVSCYNEQKKAAQAAGMSACVDYFLNYDLLLKTLVQLLPEKGKATKQAKVKK